MSEGISCADLATLMGSDGLFAVFDVRERGEFDACQIAGATSLPRSHIEFRAAQLVPGLEVPVVVYDEGGERAMLARNTLAGLGYRRVSMLEGGLNQWQREQRATTSGVNVPSKAFGERVYHQGHVPEIGPEELFQLQQRRIDLTILDVRTPEEYARFCIPGGLNVPGGDLILWAEALRQKRDATVVVNCAGRTRSIIGTAALRRLGLTNVRALRNGTMGWVLAGFDLETRPGRGPGVAPEVSRARAKALALGVAEEEKIPWISAEEVMSLMGVSSRGVTYLIDVRSEPEYETSHIPGSLNVPGGQAVQRADDFVAVRNGRIIFVSNESARAVMAAYWYRQMGFPDVTVLREGLAGWSKSGGTIVSGAAMDAPLGWDGARSAVRLTTAADLDRTMLGSSVLLIDVGSSADFEAAHLPGAAWISRGWLELKLPEQFPDRLRPIVVTCPDGGQSTFAARALTEIGYKDVRVLDGGVRAWSAAGLRTENGRQPCLTEPNDIVLSPSVRGDKQAMRRYLDWEVKLRH